MSIQARGPIPLPRPMKEGVVWHYTGTAGLQGIVENNSLWASSPQVLNDLSEIGYGERLVKEVWRDIRQENLSEQAIQLLDKMLDHSFADTLSQSVFVVSASDDPDLLNQWAHYGGAAGFAIGLNARTLLTVDGESYTFPRYIGEMIIFTSWYKVIYKPCEQKEAIEKLLRFMIERVHEDGDSIWLDGEITSNRFFLRTLITQLKHPAFSAEKEVRYIAALPPSKDPVFRSTAERLIPYVNLSPARLDLREEENPQMISGITLGPSVRPGTREVVGRLLASKNVEGVQITDSEIPYLASRY